MAYDYIREEFYDRTLFSFDKDDQPIIVTFDADPEVEDKYLVIVFAELGGSINNPHDPEFAETLDNITAEFADGRDLFLEAAAV
ncbi:hypothetical protein [Flagellimonas flava]|uniref:hypothetical protein n=1 Tax=Flagellimonas flava TaxID=570519 RepID=UPI003D650E28